MKKQILVSLFLAASMVTAAHAEEQTNQSANTSTLKVSDVQKKDEKQKDIDDEITNARLRATLGSKSKWSFKSALAYNGGSLEKPFDRIRPNYRASAAAESLTNLAGTIGINYRLTDRDNLSLSTGVSMRNPFHDETGRSEFEDPRKSKKGKNVDRYYVSNPSLDWSRAYKASGLQMISEAGYTQVTDPDAIANTAALGSISLGQTVLADFGTSNWSGGLSFSFYYSLYSADTPQLGVQNGWYQDDYGYGIYPFAEYTFSDKYSFRTVFGYFEAVHYKDGQAGALPAGQVQSQTPYQSMGIGISVTRDIYLYPNIQFTPLDVRADRTNVALSTNINLF
ncbi:MAG: hypothetical protein ACXVCP_12680 [Bdellovibrio sp.]